MSTTTLTTIVTNIGPELFMVILGGFLVYWFGFRAYIKQRKWELIRKTYIEGSIGRVMEDIDRLSEACYMNYSKAIFIFKILESTTKEPENMKKQIDKIFSEMQEVKVAPNYGTLKLSIFNEQDLVLLVVVALTQLSQLNENIRHIIEKVTEDYFAGQNDKSENERKDFLSENKQILREEWNNVISKYEPLKGRLLSLQIEIDEMNYFSINDLNKIAKKKSIVKIIKDIKEIYKKEIEQIKNKTLIK